MYPTEHSMNYCSSEDTKFSNQANKEYIFLDLFYSATVFLNLAKKLAFLKQKSILTL
jgi:hypothetical protein